MQWFNGSKDGAGCGFSDLTGRLKARIAGTQSGVPRRCPSPCRWLWITVTLCLLCRTTGASATITLNWNASTGTNITYRLYTSVGSGPFNLTGSALTGTQAIVSYDPTVTTRWRVTAYSTAYATPESDPSNTVTNTPPPPPLSGLSFEAESGAITPPFYISADGTRVQQDAQSGASDGGRASYTFTVTNAGTYTVSGWVNAPDEGANSFFVAIDAEPNDAHIWDVPLTSGVQERKVQWRTDTNAHVFALTAAQHVLVVRGREGGAQLDRLAIVPVAVTQPPQPIPGPPPVPQQLRAVQVTAQRLDLGWVSDPTALTEVWRSVEFDPLTPLETVSAGTMHTSTTIRKKRTYEFRVRSRNSVGVSPFSNSVIVSSQ